MSKFRRRSKLNLRLRSWSRTPANGLKIPWFALPTGAPFHRTETHEITVGHRPLAKIDTESLVTYAFEQKSL